MMARTKRKAKCPKCGTTVICTGNCYIKTCPKCGWDVYFAGATARTSAFSS
jgi:ribosomal protein S27AE